MGAEEAVFTWANPDPQEGDFFVWALAELGGEPQWQRTDETTVTVPAGEDRVCIEVSLVRADGRASAQNAEECATR